MPSAEQLALVLLRQVARQALTHLAVRDPLSEGRPLAHAGNVQDAVIEHLTYTAAHSALLRTAAAPDELAVALAQAAADSWGVVRGVRWAPSLSDQISYVLLRMLGSYELQVRALADEVPQ